MNDQRQELVSLVRVMMVANRRVPRSEERKEGGSSEYTALTLVIYRGLGPGVITMISG